MLDRQTVNGILLLDKPHGISSNLALQKAKRLLKAKKAGHTGSLDPSASGMLPICFGEATKFSRFLLEERKRYRAVIHLGITTTTGDTEGQIVHVKSVPSFSLQKIEMMLDHFKGDLLQIPPMYSAIKFQGQPLYKLARQGREIPRKQRAVTIYHLTLEDIGEKSHLLTIVIECSKGTYIRTLVEEMGAYLGCGAHVAALRRLTVCPFKSEGMINLTDLEEIPIMLRYEKLLSMSSVFSHLLPVYQLDQGAAQRLRHGQKLKVSHQAGFGWVSLYLENVFIGVGEIGEDYLLCPRRLLQVSETLDNGAYAVSRLGIK